MKNSKRLLTLVLVLALSLALLLVLGSCKKHECEFIETATEDYLKSAATCTDKAVYYKSCSCGEVSDETFEYGEPNGHVYAEVASDATLKTPATCTTAAVYYESCSVCGEKGTATFTSGSELGHSYEANAIDSALKSAATCTSPAVYFKSCSKCGENSSESFVFGSNVAHTITHHPAKDATNDEDGNVEYWSCSGCNKYFSDADATVEIEDKTTVFIPAINHQHTFDQKNADDAYLVSEATCTSAAVYNYSCACGEKGSETFTSGDTIPHSFVENPIDRYLVSKATCQQLAVYCKGCSECDLKGTETYVYGELAAHETTYHEATLPTCGADGNREYWSCDVCAKLFDDEACTNNVKYTDLVVSGGHNLVQIASEEYLKTPATCQSPAVYFKHCSNCSDASSETFTYGDLGGHNIVNVVVEADCTHDGYITQKCDTLGCTFSETVTGEAKLGHSYEDTVIEPTCGATGLKTSVCSVCSDTKTEIIAALGHSYAESVVAPTCDNGGYTVHTCSECGDSYNSDVTEALGHDFSVLESKAATCTEAGYVKYVCANGGCAKEETQDALGHSVVGATCTTDSYCSACGETLTEKAMGHAWNDGDVTLPTCTEAGYAIFTCLTCGEKKTVTDGYLATGHSKNIEWTEQEVAVEGETCMFQTVQSGVCPDCGDTLANYGEITVVHNHVFTITTQATCCADGIKTYTCTGCSDSYTESYSAPEAHNYDENGVCECGKTKTVIGGNSTTASGDDLKNELEFDDASLTLDSATQEQLGGSDVDLSVGTVDQGEVDKMAEGLTEEQKALLEGKPVYNFEMSVNGESVTSFNGKVTIKIPYVLAEGEDPDDIVVWYLAPMTNESGEVVHVPTLVEAKYIEIGDQGYAVFETEHFSYYTVTKLTAAQRCEKFGHNILTTNVIATCLTEGYTLDYCMRCGEKNFYDFVPALGHDFILQEHTYVELSCTTDGYEHHWCSRCGVGFDVITETTGHEWEFVSGNAATCTTVGNETFKCLICGEEKVVTSPVLPHNFKSEFTEATCTTAGYTVNVCDCGYSTMTDYVAPYGHNDIVTVYAPTCLEQGYTEHYCDLCDSVFKKDNYTDKVDHEWNVEEPDCENDKICKHCQKLDKPSNGHKFVNGKCEHCASDCPHNNIKYSHDQKATCDQVGYKLYLCKDCHNFVAGEEIPSPPHNYNVVREIEATCISPAYTVYKCQKCKHEHYEPKGEPTEHKYSGGVCTYCGKDNNNFYLTLVESLFNVDGFAIKLENVSFIYESRDAQGLPWIEEGYIKQLDVSELMINIDRENGITGEAACSFVLLGPADYEITVYGEAIIKNGYIYIDSTSDYDQANLSVRYSVDAVFGEYFEGDISNVWDVFDVFVEDVLPVIELLAEANAADLEQILSNVMDMIFSYENVNGNYEYVLDFAKINQLSENIKNLPVSEVVDLYFGEGTFDDIYLTALEILELKLSEVPAYAAQLGVDEETLIATANIICKKILGAPDDYDINDMLNSEEAQEYTVGMLVMQGEYDEDMIHEIANMLRELTAYELIWGENYNELAINPYEMISDMIELFESGVVFGFTTDKNGNILSCDLSANNLEIPESDYHRYILGGDLSVEVGGSIDSGAEDIIPEIDNLEDAIPERENATETNKNNYGENWGEMDYNGQWVSYVSYAYELCRYENNYSNILGYSIMPHCADWVEYSILHERIRSELYLEIRCLELGSGEIYLIMSEEKILAELTISEDGIITYVRADGTTGSFEMKKVVISLPTIKPDDSYDDKSGKYDFGVEYPTIDGVVVLYNYFQVVNLILDMNDLNTCIGELGWRVSNSYSTSYSFYYNTVTGEYADKSQHNYIITETKNPVSCGEPGYNVFTCEHCGDSYKNYFNNFGHSFEIDMDQSVIRDECNSYSELLYVCVDCGESYRTEMWNDHNWQYIYTLHEGSMSCNDGLDCAYGCVECGEVQWFNEYWAYGHQGKYEYSYIDGEVRYNSVCVVCGYKISDGTYLDVDAENIDITLDSGDQLLLVITPTQTGIYEFFTSGGNRNEWIDTWATLYDAYGNHLLDSDNGAIDNHFGMLYELEAGKTYMLSVTVNGAMKSGITLNIKPHDSSKDMSFAHSDYGCDCGGESIVRVAFGGCIYIANPIGSKECMIYCDVGYNYYFDGCNEFMVQRIYMYNRKTGEQIDLCETDPVYTGNSQHSINSEWFNERSDITDDYGNYIGWWHKDGNTNVCYYCGTTVGKYENVYYYDLNGNQIKYDNLSYSANIDGSLYLSHKASVEYMMISNAYGEWYQRVVSEIREDYDNSGNVISYERTSYEYSGCMVTEKYESTNGKENYERVYFNHSESEKELPDESSTFDNGDGTTTQITTWERYCTICAASLSKYSEEYTNDANGNAIKHVHKDYVSYAISEDVYGYRLSKVTTETYYNYEYRVGRYVRRTLTIYTEDYDENGEVSYWESTEYQYNYGNWCVVDVVVSSSKGDSYVWWEGYENHQMNMEYRLHEGSVTCYDGVDLWYSCLYCEYEYLREEYVTHNHEIDTNLSEGYWDEVYNLSDFGSQCGGYVYVSKCACGEKYELDVRAECSFDSDYNWIYDNHGKLEYYIYTYGCSVTHTYEGYNPCGFVYTYEHWLSIDDDCRLNYNYKYTFNANSANPFVIEWSYRSTEYRHITEQHSFDGTYRVEDGYEVYTSGYEDICKKCNHKTQTYTCDTYMYGSLMVKMSDTVTSYNEDGSINLEFKETYVTFTNPITNDRIVQSVYHAWIYYHGNTDIQNVQEHFSDYEWVYSKDRNEVMLVVSVYDNRYYESAEAYRSGNPDSWNKEEYDYSECVCDPIVRYTTSDGTDYTYNKGGSHYSFTNYYWIEEPTCTQDGVRGHSCRWCDAEFTWTERYDGHNYYLNDETGTYCCSRCKLENFTGYDGDIVVEDLTWKLGEGKRYAIGYYDRKGIPFEIYVSLIVVTGSVQEDGYEEYLLNDFIAMENTGSIIYIDMADLAAAIENMAKMFGESFSICADDCMIRVNFVPEYNDYDFDYAITLDPHVVNYGSASISYDNGIQAYHSASCTLCGLTVKSNEACDFVLNFSDSEIVEGFEKITCTYRCRHCTNEYTVIEYTELTDSSCCKYTHYVKYMFNGNEVVKSGYTEIIHSYEYQINRDILIDTTMNSFGAYHDMVCTTCGDVQYSEPCRLWEWNNNHVFYYVENGIQKQATHYYCNLCGFEYKLINYEELVDAASCKYINHHFYYWDYSNGVYANEFEGYAVGFFKHTFIYVTDYSYNGKDNMNAGDIYGAIPGYHTAYCQNCGLEQKENCGFGSWGEHVYVNGVEHYYEYYTCYSCQFEYTLDRYSEDVSCGRIEHRIYTWVDQNGNTMSHTEEYADVYHYYYCYYYTLDDGRSLRVNKCTNCDTVHNETYVGINLDNGIDISLFEGQGSHNFNHTVTVSQTGDYRIYFSNHTYSVNASIWNDKGEYIAYNNGYDMNNYYFIEVTLNAGETYYLTSGFVSDIGPDGLGVMGGQYNLNIEKI